MFSITNTKLHFSELPLSEISSDEANTFLTANSNDIDINIDISLSNNVLSVEIGLEIHSDRNKEPNTNLVLKNLHTHNYLNDNRLNYIAIKVKLLSSISRSTYDMKLKGDISTRNL